MLPSSNRCSFSQMPHLHITLVPEISSHGYDIKHRCNVSVIAVHRHFRRHVFKLKKEQMHKCNKKCKNEAAQSNTAFTCLRYFSFSTPADIRSKISILVIYIYIYMMIFCVEYFQPALGFAPITKCLTKALNVQVE